MIASRSSEARLKAIIRPILWHRPLLYWAFALIRHRKSIYASNYHLLIDGYPRSANTFAVHALKSIWKAGVVVSHFHSPASIVAATTRSKPVVVLMRQPEDAIVAWTALSGYPLDYTIHSYIDYYETVAPVIDKCYVALFPDVTQNFFGFAAGVKRRFRLGFDVPSGEYCSPEYIFQSIDDDFKSKNGVILESRVARPSMQREKAHSEIRADLRERKWIPLLRRATAIYEKLRCSK